MNLVLLFNYYPSFLYIPDPRQVYCPIEVAGNLYWVNFRTAKRVFDSLLRWVYIILLWWNTATITFHLSYIYVQAFYFDAFKSSYWLTDGHSGNCEEEEITEWYCGYFSSGKFMGYTWHIWFWCIWLWLIKGGW